MATQETNGIPAKADDPNGRGDDGDREGSGLSPLSGGGARLLARYNPAVKELAVAEVDHRRLQNPRDRTIYREVARQFGVGEQSLRLWVKKMDTERFDEEQSQERAAQTMSPEQMKGELHLLRREIQQLRSENEVLKRAFVVFSSEWGGK